MNWTERAYFNLFVLWSRKRKDRDIAGIWALLTLFLGFWFNIGTLLLFTIAFKLFEYNLPEPPNRLIMMAVVGLLIGLTATLVMRRQQRKMYRNELLKMSLDDIELTSRNAAIYVVGTLVVFFGTAFIMVNFFI